MKPRLRRCILIATLTSAGLLTLPVHAQPMPREDVVDVPAIGEGLCISNVFQTNMVLQRDKPPSDFQFLTAAQKSAVRQSGQTVVDISSLHELWERLDRPIQVSLGNDRINVVARWNQRKRLLHLMNMQPETENCDFKLILSAWFAGPVESATLYSPSRDSIELPCQVAGRFVEIFVPYLKQWGIVTLQANDGSSGEPAHSVPFPAKLPLEKPADQRLSAAMERLYDEWNPLGDRANELYSNFKYSPLGGFSYENNTSRRDPSKVLRINGVYYVWYTRRRTAAPPAGPASASDTVPSFDWDLAEIWYATSRDGFRWEEQGPAVKRPPKGQYGWRSISTPDVLAWGGKYYLYYQGFNEIPGLKGDRAAATVAEADSPHGPWRPLRSVVVDFGAEGEWDSAAIHDPYPLVYRGKIYLYYKGSPGKQGADNTLVRAQGLAIADHPLGPFTKSPSNPVLNSGHETCLWPWKEGVAAIVSLDGPEKNTVQYAADGISFQMMSILQIPPVAPGPFVSDAFADNANGRGFTWGLCHINPDGGASTNHSILARFDCDLSLDVDRPALKHNNLRFDERTYFQERVKLPDHMFNRIKREREKVDRDTVLRAK